MSDNGTFTVNRLENKDIGIVSPAYPVFKTTNIDDEYLKYYFQSDEFKKAIYNLSQGSTRTSLKFKDLIEIEYLLPPLEEQKKIVNILKNVDSIIEKYESLLKYKEQFIKSQFVEMFGDVINNEFNYSEFVLSDLANIGSSKRIYASEYCENGIPFYRSKEIIELGKGQNPSLELYISEERYNEIKNKFGIPKKGDILITAVGTIGETWIVNTDNPFYYKDGNILCVSLIENINETFFKFLLDILVNNFKKQNVSGSAYAALTIEKFKNMKIINPPLELQNKFANLVEQIDKYKFELEKIIGYYRDLKKGLMQQLLTGKIKI